MGGSSSVFGGGNDGPLLSGVEILYLFSAKGCSAP